jgi:hypothetical protein
MTQLRFITNTTAAVAETEYDGTPYLIAPVVAIREGVLNDMLYLADEIGRYAEAWNGHVVPISHPKRNGEYVSANSPDIWASEVVGNFWNVAMDGDRLKGEIWVDLNKAEKIGEPALAVVERLRAGEPIEVSTGLFADLEETPGTWNGKSYIGIARNIRPDHLALLPNEIGACSWEDGCGTPRVNQQKGEGMGDELKTNELTLDDRAIVVRRAFWQRVYDSYDAGDMSDIAWGDWDVVSVFDATVIAKNWDKKNHMAFPYTINDSGEVTFGDPTAVEVVYRAKEGGAEVVIANGDNRPQSLFTRIRHWMSAGKSKLSDVQNVQQEDEVSKCDRVAALVANKQCKFSKETLDKWSEADLETLQQSLATNSEAQPEQAAPLANQAPVSSGFDAKQLGEMIRGIVNETVAPVLQTINANADRERAELVAEIVANEQSQFEEADLQDMPVDKLRKLAASLQPRDYSGGAGIFRNSGSEDEEYVMPMAVAWPVKEDK